MDTGEWIGFGLLVGGVASVVFFLLWPYIRHGKWD